MSKRRLTYDDYKVGWVCALPIELAAAEQLLEERHSDLPPVGADDNLYALGCIAGHNVVIASLPEGQMGNVSAATAAVQMNSTFKFCRFTLLVGIGGGVPSQDHDVRLGDVVVQKPVNDHGGVIQYDMGKVTPTGNIRTGSLTSPPRVLLNALAKIRANTILGKSTFTTTLEKLGDDIPSFSRTKAGRDVLFQASYNHPGGRTCERCDTTRVVQRSDRPQTNDSLMVVHYGAIASGNRVMKDAATRDSISKELGGVLCFEMEAAGLATSMSCLVIRGISDYADSHKNDTWQPHAAAAAAAFAKEILSVVPPAVATEAESATLTAQAHIVKWLSPLNFFITHHDVLSRHVSGTGKELLESSKFLSWLATPGVGLWCQGSRESSSQQTTEMDG
jgi:nucleoside phosphorylase